MQKKQMVQSLRKALMVALLLLPLVGLLLVRGAEAQEPTTKDADEAQANLSGAITYQGYLEDNDNPANGTYDFEFKLYDADGTQVGPTNSLDDISVTDGHFSVSLNFYAAIAFTGDARWLELAVRPGNSTGSYTTLMPRQALTGVPYAHSLRPKAIIENEYATARIIYDHSNDIAENYTAGLYGESNGTVGTGVRGEGSVYGIYGIGSIGVYGDGSIGVYGETSSSSFDSAGVKAVSTSSAPGVVASSTNGDGIYIESAHDDGLHVASASNGVYVQSATSNGVHVQQARDGVMVSSADANGVYVDSAGDDGFNVCQAGLFSGICPLDGGHHGLEVGYAQHDGVHVIQAGDDGIEIQNSNYGLYIPVPGVSNIALLVGTSNSNGEWALDTSDKIRASNVTFNSLTLVAKVDGPTALTAGDVVAVAGMTDPLPDSLTPLPLVRLADGQRWTGVVGVVESRMELQLAPGKEEEGVQILHSVDGPAETGDYVALTVFGVAQVKVDTSTADIVPGQRLTAANLAGHVRALHTEKLNEMTVTEGAPVIGIALDTPKTESDTIPVFVTLR